MIKAILKCNRYLSFTIAILVIAVVSVGSYQLKLARAEEVYGDFVTSGVSLELSAQKTSLVLTTASGEDVTLNLNNDVYETDQAIEGFSDEAAANSCTSVEVRLFKLKGSATLSGLNDVIEARSSPESRSPLIEATDSGLIEYPIEGDFSGGVRAIVLCQFVNQSAIVNYWGLIGEVGTDSPGGGGGGGGTGTPTCGEGGERPTKECKKQVDGSWVYVCKSGAEVPYGQNVECPNEEAWYDSRGGVVGLEDIGSRFKFLSVMELVDNTTGTKYVAKGPPRAQGGSSENNSYMADGVVWYRPAGSDGKAVNGKCAGTFAVTFRSGNGNGTEYGRVYFVHPKNENGTCTFDSAPMSALDGFFPTDKASFTLLTSGQGEGYNRATERFSYYNIQALYAPLAWKNKNTILSIGTGTELKKVSGDNLNALAERLSRDPTELESSYSIWTSDKCLEGVSPGEGFSFIYFQAGRRGTDYKQARIMGYGGNPEDGSQNTFDAPYYDERWRSGGGKDISCLLGVDVDKSPYQQAGHSYWRAINDEDWQRLYIGMAYPENAELTEAEATPLPGSINGGGGGGDNGGGGGGGAEDGGNTCSVKAGPLGWILCPILMVLDSTTQGIESLVQNFLFVDTSNLTTESGAYKAWSTFRGLATVIIVIIALIMIFSQAMGDGIFDNYSVKKILPRLIIAGIGIQLSWFLMVALVNVFNTIGNGIGGIMLSSFNLTQDTNLTQVIGNKVAGASAADVLVGGLFVGLAIVAPVLMAGIIAIAIGVLGAVLIGIITLILRDMIILLGIVFAPLAIAMSVLPGTQKTSKWWWESFEKALMMYPIVMAMLAAGKVVGSLMFDMAVNPNDPDDLNIVYLLAGIIAWYLPFFLLPKALQAGGQALGKLTGFVGDKGKGLSGKLTGWNDNRKKQKTARTQRNAFDQKHISWYAKGSKNPLKYVDRGFKAKTRGGAYLAAGAVGAGTAYERGTLRVKNAQEAAQRRLFDEATAKTELQVKEDQTASERAFTNASIDSQVDVKDAAGNVIITSKNRRQQIYAELAQLKDGERREIEVNGEKTTFVGSWAVRSKAMESMLKNKMIANVYEKDLAGNEIVDPAHLIAAGLSDFRNGVKGGVFAQIESSGDPGLVKSVASFTNSNFGDVKASMPDVVGDGPDKWGTFGADKLEGLDKSRKAEWRRVATDGLSAADATARAKNKLNLYNQINDLAKNGKDKEFADELIKELRDSRHGGAYDALADNAEKALLSRGAQRIDDSGNLV